MAKKTEEMLFISEGVCSYNCNVISFFFGTEPPIRFEF